MITKTLTGIRLFDERHGGMYRGRSLLVCGQANAGKTVCGLQFIQQGLRQGDRCLMLSVRLAADLIIYAEALDLPIGDAVNAGTLTLLEYQNYVPGRDREESLMLPPDSFIQLKHIIDTTAVQRVVLDTVLPWVCIPSPAKLAEHVFSFVRAFDRLNTTTLLTIPKPVSPMAFRLKSALEEVVPAAVMLTLDAERGARRFHVTKYLGEKRLSPAVEFSIVPGQGFAEGPSRELPAPPAATRPPAHPESARLAAAAVQAAVPTDPRPKPSFAVPTSRSDGAPNKKVRFSAVIPPLKPAP